MKTLQVFYTDGSSYITDANSTPGEFFNYLTQNGADVVTHEDDKTGKETVKTVSHVRYYEDGDKEQKILELTEHLRRTTRAIENMLENYEAGEFTATAKDGQPANFDHAKITAAAARKYYMGY